MMTMAMASGNPHSVAAFVEFRRRRRVRAGGEAQTTAANAAADDDDDDGNAEEKSSTASVDVEREVMKVVRRTAGTFAPRSSTVKKNPAVEGSYLYRIFEVQGYGSMAVGGLLAFNLIFPSNEADIWRLMGMWSVWMFSIPSLRARECSVNEKDALNYLFLIIPLINVTLPLVWKSFGVVWSADVFAFFVMYAWKMKWLQKHNS